MAVSNLALVSRAEVESYLGLTGTAELDALIDGCSAALESEALAVFVQRTITEYASASQFLGGPREGGRSILALKNYPVVSVTSISDPAGNVITATDYRIEGEKGYLIRPGGWPTPVNANGLVDRWKVIMTAGHFATTAAVDAALKLACKKLVAFARQNTTPGVLSKTGGLISITYRSAGDGGLAPSGVPLEVAAMLGPWKSREV